MWWLGLCLAGKEERNVGELLPEQGGKRNIIRDVYLMIMRLL